MELMILSTSSFRSPNTEIISFTKMNIYFFSKRIYINHLPERFQNMEIFLEDHQTFSYLGSIYQLDHVSKYAKKKYQNMQMWDCFLALLPLVGKIQGCATKMCKHIEP
jgi:hypothetical protein